MKRLTLSLTALALSSVCALSTVAPGEAMPVPTVQLKQGSDVENVKMVRRPHNAGRMHMSRHNSFKHGNRGWHGKRSWHNNRSWHGHRGYYHSWRGHRGYPYYRPGYRRYNGWWYPAAAFTTGVVIGTTVRGGNAHVRWCRNHYVSYRASDNTFQPYNGPRQECVSP